MTTCNKNENAPEQRGVTSNEASSTAAFESPASEASKSDPARKQSYALGEWEAFEDYLDTLDFGPGQRDHSGHCAFLRAGSLRIDAGDALVEVARRIKATGGSYMPGKLQSQVRRAYEHLSRPSEGLRALVKPPRPAYCPAKLRQCASRVSGIDSGWLRRHSPVEVQGISSAQFLEALYQPGEQIVIFTDFQSQGQCIHRVGERSNSPLPAGGPEGVWFLSNPVDGRFHPNPRQENKLSRRSEEAVTAWRYLVLESDVAEPAEWLSCLVQFPLRIVAVYTSGGKSIHALVRLDASSKQEWDQKKDAIKNAVVTLGADEHALTAVRLSRLPGTMRGQRLQELLYLAPDADGRPIIGGGR